MCSIEREHKETEVKAAVKLFQNRDPMMKLICDFEKRDESVRLQICQIFFLRLLYYCEKLRAKYCIHLLGNCNNKETIRQDFGSFFFREKSPFLLQNCLLEMKITFPTYFSLFFTCNSLFLLLHVRLGMAWLDSCA